MTTFGGKDNKNAMPTVAPQLDALLLTTKSLGLLTLNPKPLNPKPLNP